MDVLIKTDQTQLCSFHIRRQHISYTDFNWSCGSQRIYPSFKKTKERLVFGVCVSFFWIIFLLTTILRSYVLVPPRKAFEMLWIKYLRGSSASYFITKQQCGYNSFEQKAFNANSFVWIMRAIYCPIYTTSLKTTYAPNWGQTPPQSFAVSAIIMGDMSLFIRANARQSITESHGSHGCIEQFLGDIPLYDLFIKTPICLIGDAH